MSFVPISQKVKRFIGAMSGSVLVAILAPLAMQGDQAAVWALSVTAAAMLVLKKPLIAITLGIVTAAIFRNFSG